MNNNNNGYNNMNSNDMSMMLYHNNALLYGMYNMLNGNVNKGNNSSLVLSNFSDNSLISKNKVFPSNKEN